MYVSYLLKYTLFGYIVMEKSSVDGNNYQWIDMLLDIPMPDARHRIIVHILAPYLINVKHLDVNTARRIIEDWVERSERTYQPVWGNTKAFVHRECQKAYETGKMPKDLERIRRENKRLFDLLARMADTYGINIQ